ncbi:hypothetical protein Tco_1257713 [Tanacetum coccineum]
MPCPPYPKSICKSLHQSIPKSLHPELPGPEDNIVDFPEGKIGVYTKFFKFANYRIPVSQFLFNILGHFQIYLSQLSVIGGAKVSHFKINCHVLNIRPTVNLFRVFYIPSYNSGMDERVFPTVVDWHTSAPKDERPAADSYSAVDVATLNLHQMEFFNLINAPNPLKVKIGAHPRLSHEVPLLTATATRLINMENTPATSVSSETPPVIMKSPIDFSNKESLQLLTKGDQTETQVVPELNLEKEAAAMRPPLNKRRRKRDKGEAEANRPLPRSQGKIMLSRSPEQDIAQSSKKAAAAEDPDSEKSISFTSMGGPPEDIYQPGWGVTSNCLLDTPEACQDMLANGFPAEAPGKRSGEAVTKIRAGLVKGQVTGKEKIKVAFEEFKKHEDERVTSRYAEMDARLDALSIDLIEKLYPHVLTAIAGHRWVIGHDLRLAVMKCAKSMELRQVFANVVSAGISKGMSEGLKHGVEHGKAKLNLAAVEAYDPKADDKFTTTFQALKDLEYPLVDQLKRLKDAPIDLIMASLYLESDTEEDAP